MGVRISLQRKSQATMEFMCSSMNLCQGESAHGGTATRTGTEALLFHDGAGWTTGPGTRLFFQFPQDSVHAPPDVLLARRMTSLTSFLSIRGRPTFSPGFPASCSLIQCLLIGFDAHQ